MNKEPVDHHFNPCFWAAHWNFNYLQAIRSRKDVPGRARQQEVYAWKLKPDKIIPSKVEDCFIERNANRTTIYHEEVLAFIQSFTPGKMVKTIGITNDSVAASFNIENLFTTMEEAYQPVLIETIRTGQINDLAVKSMLSFFIFTQSVRNPSTLNFLKNTYTRNAHDGDEGNAVFDLFVNFRNVLEDRDKLMEAIIPFIAVKWVLYKTRETAFPLCDHPLLFIREKLVLPLAPDLLLEIHLNKPVPATASPCEYRNRLPYTKYRQFRDMTKAQAQNEMIFGRKRFFFKNLLSYLFHI